MDLNELAQWLFELGGYDSIDDAFAALNAMSADSLDALINAYQGSLSVSAGMGEATSGIEEIINNGENIVKDSFDQGSTIITDTAEQVGEPIASGDKSFVSNVTDFLNSLSNEQIITAAVAAAVLIVATIAVVNQVSRTKAYNSGARMKLIDTEFEGNLDTAKQIIRQRQILSSLILKKVDFEKQAEMVKDTATLIKIRKEYKEILEEIKTVQTKLEAIRTGYKPGKYIKNIKKRFAPSKANFGRDDLKKLAQIYIKSYKSVDKTKGLGFITSLSIPKGMSFIMDKKTVLREYEMDGSALSRKSGQPKPKTVKNYEAQVKKFKARPTLFWFQNVSLDGIASKEGAGAKKEPMQVNFYNTGIVCANEKSLDKFKFLADKFLVDIGRRWSTYIYECYISFGKDSTLSKIATCIKDEKIAKDGMKRRLFAKSILYADAYETITAEYEKAKAEGKNPDEVIKVHFPIVVNENGTAKPHTIDTYAKFTTEMKEQQVYLDILDKVKTAQGTVNEQFVIDDNLEKLDSLVANSTAGAAATMATTTAVTPTAETGKPVVKPEIPYCAE